MATNGGLNSLNHIVASKVGIPDTILCQLGEQPWEGEGEGEGENTFLQKTSHKLKKNFIHILQDVLKIDADIVTAQLHVACSHSASLEFLLSCISRSQDNFLHLFPMLYSSLESARYRHIIKIHPSDFLVQNFLNGDSVKECNVGAEIKRAIICHNIKGVFLSNPVFNLGGIVRKSIMQEIVDACIKNDLHLVVDETLAFLQFDQSNTFNSVLQLTRGYPKVHVLWNLAEAMHLGELPIAIVWNSWVLPVEHWSSLLTIYTVPPLTYTVYERLTADIDWIKDTFLPERKRQLEEAYLMCRLRLDEMGVPYIPAHAGRHICIRIRPDGRQREDLLEQVVSSTSGTIYVVSFANSDWCSLMFFTSCPILYEGLEILQRVLNGDCVDANASDSSSISTAIEAPEDTDENLEVHLGCAQKEGSNSDASESLTDLVKDVFGALKRDKKWVSEHTVERMEKENPELLQAFRDLQTQDDQTNTTGGT